MADSQALSVPGWDVVNDDGLFIATRRGELSEYQQLNGAVTEVTARNSIELLILCDAHWTLADRLAMAEDAHPRVQPIGVPRDA